MFSNTNLDIIRPVNLCKRINWKSLDLAKAHFYLEKTKGRFGFTAWHNSSSRCLHKYIICIAAKVVGELSSYLSSKSPKTSKPVQCQKYDKAFTVCHILRIFVFWVFHTTQNWKGKKHKLSSSSLQMELLSSNLELHPQPADGIFWIQIFRCTHKQQLANGNFWVPIFRDPFIVATACRWNFWVPIFRCTHSCSNSSQMEFLGSNLQMQ
jgi:hypothetical protein